VNTPKKSLKKVISIKIDEQLLEDLDKLEGSRSSNIVKAIEMYLERNTKDYRGITDNYHGITNDRESEMRILEEYNTFLKERIRELENANSELRRSLAYEQQAHLTSQKQLPPAQKKWWQFWKR